MKKKNSFHLILIAILLVLFLAIMFLSTALQDVSIDYSYINEVDSHDYGLSKIGTVEIKNNGFMPAKVDLNNLVGCTLDDREFGFNSIYIYYSKVDSTYMDGYRRSVAELSSYESQKLSIVMSSIPKRIDGGSQLKSETVYIFNTKENDNYEFCAEVLVEDAIHKVEVNYLDETK